MTPTSPSRPRSADPLAPVRRGALAAVLATALVSPAPLRAQEAPAGVDPWDTRLEANASLFFGATAQQLISTNVSVSRKDSLAELETVLRYRYGETSDAEGDRFVSSRAWFGSFTMDVTPFGRFSPFVSTSVESSLEKRIDQRASGGLGVKWTFDSGKTSTSSLSLALLGERTRGRAPADTIRTLARWSARLRTQRRIADRVSASHTTFYRPEARNLEEFTLTTTSQLAVDVRQGTSLTLTLVDNYDSEATRRGARSNNDGQLLFGVRTEM